MGTFNVKGTRVEVREIQKESIMQPDGSWKDMYIMRVVFKDEGKRWFIPIGGTKGDLVKHTEVLNDVFARMEKGRLLCQEDHS